MFAHIKDTTKVLSSKKYGEMIALLSTTEKKTNLRIIDTIVLSIQTFREYYKNRYINDEIIDSAIRLLNSHGILSGNPITMGISVYKECLIPTRYMMINNNFTNIKYALTKLYEAWFDEKPLSYRITHKIAIEDTFPAIFIQPAPETDYLFSVITRNPVNGAILRSDNWQNNVHCKFSFFNETINNIVNDIDYVFAKPKKINFTVDVFENASIIKLENYPMTRKAYFNTLMEKHREKRISNEEFLLYISPDDMVQFDGYRINVPFLYKQVLALSIGRAQGHVVFTSTDLSMLRKNGNEGPYILIAIEICPDDIELLLQCSGAIFVRGGMTSHGANACRGMRIPAIADDRFDVDSKNQVAYALGHEIREGDYISIYAQSEKGWGLGDCIVPYFKMQTDNGSYSYLVEVLHEYDDVSLFSRCDMDFQLHYARIKEALHRLGI